MKKMPRTGLLVLFAVIFLCGFHPFGTVASGQDSMVAPETGSLQSPDCRKIVEAIEQQKAVYMHEMAQLKREIAALRQEMTNPGIRDVAAGIGYIFGLMGVALYFCARKKGTSSRDH